MRLIGFDFEKDANSDFFIVTSIIVKGSEIEKVETGVERVRRHFFGEKGEMKSSSVGTKVNRRNQILKSLLDLDSKYQIYSLVVDKRKLYKNSGLMYKSSFYKYLNDLLHTELKKFYSNLIIISDQIGSDTFMESFEKYTMENCRSLLWDQFDFRFENSKNNSIIQLADFIGGTLSFMFEERKKKTNPYNYIKMIQPRLLSVDCWPNEFSIYIKPTIGRTAHDQIVAETSLRSVESFINKNEKSTNPDVINQVAVAKYFRFALQNLDEYGYISANEILDTFPLTKRINDKYLRMKVISKLRDAGVIIASSSRGYKLPSSVSQLYDYINSTNSVIIPMLHRLRKCRRIISAATNGELDVLNSPEYREIKEILDYKDHLTITDK